MNLGVVRVGGSQGRPTIDLGDGTELDVPDGALETYPKVSERVGSQVVVGMRPEHFLRADDVADGGLRWPGRQVALVEMLGAEMLVHFETKVPPVVTDDMREAIDDDDAFELLKEEAKTGGQKFVGRFEPGAPPEVGSEITVGFRMDRLHFFDIESGEALR